MMSTQSITDYLIKQIFIEKNIVTFRSLSRHLAIHVNAAKNELATYHHNAPYQLQTCVATFMLSGTLINNARHKNSQNSEKEYYTDSTQPTNAGEEEEENDGEEVPQMTVMIVNERDLEDAKALFDDFPSIHVYSLSPCPLHDAGLLCHATGSVRNTDKSKGPEFAITVGRIVGKGIKVGAAKKKMQPPAPVAGPSMSKQPAAPEPIPEAKEKSSAAPEKPKASGKLMNFFSAPAKPKDNKEVKKVKQEDSASETTKRMFFSKAPAKATLEPPQKADASQKVKQEDSAPETTKRMFFSKAPAKATLDPPQKADAPQKVDAPQKADVPQKVPSPKTSTSKVPSRAPSVLNTKEEKEPDKEKEKSTRGIKRKSSVGQDKRDKPLENTAHASKAEGSTRIRRKVVLSDDDEEEIIPKKSTARKSRTSYRTESVENSDAENDVMGLMDIADDKVEKVSRVPSTNASSNERDEFEDVVDGDESMHDQDEDVHMSDDRSTKAKVTRKRKPKAVIPVGRNGLKKRKVTKTRRTKDSNGYIVKEDYSDWESVDSNAEPEEPAPPKTKPKAKPKAVSVKAEEEEVQIKAVPAPKEVKEPAKKKAPVKPAAVTSKPKPAAKTGGAKTQPGLRNFFGPKKTT